MQHESNFFRKGRSIIGGYYVPVRNSVNYQIVYEHIGEHEKELYEQTFGLTILTDKQFFEWWEKVHQEHNV